ncbi:MAG: DUF3422 family protein [Alphaproteobacteria bacterium]|nr:DUF3422 family protein [Alphaproteobacteria bacterium SS10]
MDDSANPQPQPANDRPPATLAPEVPTRAVMRPAETVEAEAVSEGANRYPFRDVQGRAAMLAAGDVPFAPGLSAPAAVSHFATVSGDSPVEADREHLGWLCYSVGANPPAPDATEHVVEFNGCLVHWRFDRGISTYTVVQRQAEGGAFASHALDALPEDWLTGLNGERLFGLHLFFEESTGPERNRAALARLFGRDDYLGCAVAGGRGQLWADWHGDADGFPRILLRDAGLGSREAGRMVVELIRLEHARVMSLAAHSALLPLAGQMAAWEQRMAPAQGDLLPDAEAAQTVREGLAAHHADRAALAAALVDGDVAQAALAALDTQRLPGLMSLSDFIGHTLAGLTRDLKQWSARLAVLTESLELALAQSAAEDRQRQAEAMQLQTAVAARTAQAQVQNRRLVRVLGLAGLTAIFAYLGQLVGEGLAAAGIVGDAGLISITAVPLALMAAYALLFMGGKGQR